MFSLSGCKIYNQNILFKTETEIKSTSLLQGLVASAEQNYIIQKNDYITMNVYTNKGEVLIEPQPPLGVNGGNNQGVAAQPALTRYLVQENGDVNLPVIGFTKLQGYTLRQADSLLSVKFSEIYKEAFVMTNYSSKRVVVLIGTSGRVIPLTYENMYLPEILALSGGVANNLRARNIRLIRGDLKDPDVYIINLSTIEGLKMANLRVQPNDIIYIEPIRKTFIESLSDISPILSFISTIIAFTLILGR